VEPGYRQKGYAKVVVAGLVATALHMVDEAPATDDMEEAKFVNGVRWCNVDVVHQNIAAACLFTHLEGWMVGWDCSWVGLSMLDLDHQ